MLSSACEYGLRAMLFLAAQPADRYTGIRAISDHLGISFPFLTKVLQQLTEAGLLLSQRGPKGGVRLHKPAEAMTIYDIVVAIDGPDLFTMCILGLPGCGDAQPCPMHAAWGPERTRLQALFTSHTLAGMAAEMQARGLRLVDAG